MSDGSLRTTKECSWKEYVSAKNDWLIRTAMMWRRWNVAGPEANYLAWTNVSSWNGHSLPTSVSELTSCD